MTIVSLVIVLYLIWGEWADYRQVVVHPELIVDKGRGMQLEKRVHNPRRALIYGYQGRKWRYT